MFQPITLRCCLMRTMPLVMLAAALCLLPTPALAQQDDLEANFQSPPEAARPWVYWFWMNGNLTEEGITADLEAMKRVGIGGTLIMSVSTGIPPGKVDFLSPEWRELFTFAVREADRLGLQIIMNNDDGWTGSGGPWNTVENSMQILTSRELRVKGPRKFDEVLPRPYAKLDYYRDIALLAIPASSKDGVDFRGLSPKVTASNPKCKVGRLMDNDTTTVGRLRLPRSGKPQWIQVECDKPFRARSFTLLKEPGWHVYGAKLLVSDDGETFREVAPLRIPRYGFLPVPAVVNLDPVEARFFRIAFESVPNGTRDVGVAEIDLGGNPRIENWPAKAAFFRVDGMEPATDTPAGGSVPREKILDITSKLDAGGRLRWDVPEGDWTLLRLGHTTNGKKNHPCSPQGVGLECDKLSKKAMNAHFDGFLAKLIADVGPLAGKTFIATHTDSWEVGCQNWTPRLREEFEARRGYDPFPYLPTLAGHVVGSPEISERFLWDYRKALAGMMADNYFGHLRALAKRHGMGMSVEAYGGGNFDNLQCATRTDIPMAEFWVNWPVWNKSAKWAASAGHVAGRKIIAAESFTATDHNGKWQNHPYRLKTLGDLMYTEGVNRFVFHRYAMQPWMDRWPGMTFGKWGTCIERTLTWFEPGRAWFKYLARCQYLLQEGSFVADLCFFHGESAPNRVLDRGQLRSALPAGYDYDGANDEAIMRMSVEDGRITLPSGMSYRVLVLPKGRFMTPELLHKVRDLVRQGAQVVGPKPEKSPSLAGYPQCDEEVQQLAGELWGDTSAPGEKVTGKGKVYWGKSLAEVLAGLDTPPDVELAGASSRSVPWIHRRIGEADVYFVSNQDDFPRSINATFRVGGEIPELWHPDTGQIEPVGVWQPTADGRTTVDFRLDPRGSVFVVFRKSAADADPVVSISRDGKLLVGPAQPPGIEIHKALYGVLDDADRTIDVTKKVAALVARGDRSVHVWSTLGGDPAYGVVKTLRVDFSIDGKRMSASARDGQKLRFPTNMALNRPVAEIKTLDGEPSLVVSKGGQYELKTASGKKIVCEVPSVPAPITLTGPWNLRFPPDRGAPEVVTLEELISWPKHADEGVKYFSGTATYRKKFDIPADRLGKGKELLLDLGRVAVMAEVKLNGQDLGILWKPPLRVPITHVAKAGTNELEVRVTNLWPNRLIGDERKPPYLKWRSNGGPAEWPDWVAEGGPVPETGRYTFTTWRHYTKDSPLLESGLLGPVTLQTSRIVPLPRIERNR